MPPPPGAPILTLLTIALAQEPLATAFLGRRRVDFTAARTWTTAGSALRTISLTEGPAACGSPDERQPGAHVVLRAGPGLGPAGVTPWAAREVYQSDRGFGGITWMSEPAVVVEGGVARWEEAVPLLRSRRGLRPASVPLTDCGELPGPNPAAASWTVSGVPLGVGGARLLPSGALELSTNAAPCDRSDVADVVLTSSADGGALRLEGLRGAAGNASLEPGTLRWTAGPSVDGLAPVELAGAFTVGDFAVVVDGVVSAVDCR